MARISLVIPAFNEAHYLPLLLDSIDTARRRYNADNGSTDGTAALARARGCRVIHVEQRVIAAARNGGAQVATGRILAFIDADSTLHADTFNAIERTLAPGLVVVGATGARFNRTSPGIVATTLIATVLFRITGLDTGVVFCRRADWETVGGYNQDRLWAEDAAFLMALKRLGRARGQRFARAKGARAITSARKFDRFGDWHLFTLLLLRGLRWLFFNRPACQRLVRSYWYQDRQ